jgi:hypothetical protein
LMLALSPTAGFIRAASRAESSAHRRPNHHRGRRPAYDRH